MNLLRAFWSTILMAMSLGAGAQNVPTAWVVNTLGETLSRVDLNSGQVTTNVLNLGSAPNDIIIEGTTAYVVNSTSNNVQVINLETAETIGTIEIYQGLNPYSIAMDHQEHAYAPNFLTGNVSVLDLESRQETTALTTGGAPEGACVYEDKLFVTDVNYTGSWTYGQGLVHVFSLPGMNPMGAIEVGLNPQAIKAGPDSRLHVVCTGDFNDISGRIDIIDPATLEVVDSIMIGGSPGSLAFNFESVGFLGAGGWGGEGRVLSYNALTHQVIHGAQNPITVPSAATGVAAMASGHFLVCCFETDQVVELESTGNQIRDFQVGDGPITLGVQEPGTGVLPRPLHDLDLSLSWNYPEPFNGATTIVFSLLYPQPALLEIFDVRGSLLDGRSLGIQKAGESRVQVAPPASWGSGVYWYRISGNRQVAQGTIHYMK